MLSNDKVEIVMNSVYLLGFTLLFCVHSGGPAEEFRGKQEGAAPPVAANTQQKDAETIWRQLRGIWIPKAIQVGGREMPEDVLAATKLAIGDRSYRVDMSGQQDQGEIRLELGQEPLAMTLIGTKGPNSGKTIPAIFKLEADRLVICYNLEGETRPTEFSSTKDSMIALIVYERSQQDQPDR